MDDRDLPVKKGPQPEPCEECGLEYTWAGEDGIGWWIACTHGVVPLEGYADLWEVAEESTKPKVN
jgi:hypothetical protein